MQLFLRRRGLTTALTNRSAIDRERLAHPMTARNRADNRAPPSSPIAAMTRTGSPTRALLALLVLWTILFSPQLFAHRAFLFGDATLFRRFSEFSRQRWVTVHERSFWNPYVFFGLPATASLADQRPQYLPDVALDVWEGLRGQPWVPPLAAPLLAHLAGVLSIALLARALWGAGTEGMVWAGLGWALMPGLLVP